MRGAARLPARVLRGTGGAIRARPGHFLGIASAVFALEIFLPPLVLTVARKPWDFFTFNPWLSRLPEYLASDTVPVRKKLEFLPNLVLFWFSAEQPRRRHRLGVRCRRHRSCAVLRHVGSLRAVLHALALPSRSPSWLADERGAQRWGGRRSCERPGAVDRAVRRDGMRGSRTAGIRPGARGAVERHPSAPRSRVAGGDRGCPDSDDGGRGVPRLAGWKTRWNPSVARHARGDSLPFARCRGHEALG